ncbi:MAG: flagellar hook-associated protein FlgK [Curvibacter sp.]|nr:MAG: flagellar hook-associated protein FlgK [Curvibacter sp.]
MSGGLLNLGARALMSNQVALQVTGNNISNVNTAGYSRQTAVMSAVQGDFTGSGYIGKGVEVSTVQRVYDEFLTKQATATASIKSLDAARADKVAQMENIFLGGTNGLGQAINNTINAFSDVANAPTDLTARTVAITQAQEMASRFQSASTQLSDLQQNAQLQLKDDQTVINSLAQQLASLNTQISFAQSSGQPPNDLLDKRDNLLSQLNQKVQTTTVKVNDGTISVFLANQPLVLGGQAASVSFSQPTEYPGDGNTLKLKITQAGGQTTEIDENTLGGGEAVGLLRFHNTDLAEARNLLGRMAVAVTTDMNEQHFAGVDLNGNTGKALFAPITMTAIPGASNSAPAALLGAYVANDQALDVATYSITLGAPSGGSPTIAKVIANTANGPIDVTSSMVTTAGPPPSYTVGGLSINALPSSAGGAAGDTFLLRPYDTAASTMSVALSSPASLAVSNPVVATPAAANQGTLSVKTIAAAPASPASWALQTGVPPTYYANNANLNDTVQITFTGPNQYNVVDTTTSTTLATGATYTPGQAISWNGWNLTLTGTPQTGDSVTVKQPTSGIQKNDGGNAKSMLALASRSVTADKTPMSDLYAGLMAQIGVRAQSAQYAADVSGSIAANAEAARTSVSGVNLDEEAAHLLQYQQAYQASAKIVSTAQSIFDTLLQVMR